jgi:hypothetical protein
MEGLPPSARLVGIGFYVAMCIAGGTLGGQELDKLLDTGKLLTVVGLAVGLVLAIWGGIQQLMEVLTAISKQRAERKND